MKIVMCFTILSVLPFVVLANEEEDARTACARVQRVQEQRLAVEGKHVELRALCSMNERSVGYWQCMEGRMRDGDRSVRRGTL